MCAQIHEDVLPKDISEIRRIPDVRMEDVEEWDEQLPKEREEGADQKKIEAKVQE